MKTKSVALSFAGEIIMQLEKLRIVLPFKTVE